MNALPNLDLIKRALGLPAILARVPREGERRRLSNALDTYRDGEGILWVHDPDRLAIRPATWRPVLTDPATEGVLLSWVRKEWSSPDAVPVRSNTRRMDGILAWEWHDLFLSEDAARILGLKSGSVGSWGHKSAVEAIVFALKNVPNRPMFQPETRR